MLIVELIKFCQNFVFNLSVMFIFHLFAVENLYNEKKSFKSHTATDFIISDFIFMVTTNSCFCGIQTNFEV